MVDTTGDLMHFTGFADRVFVGKSLFRREGQNPLEAANAGKWIVTGPGMDNFRQVVEDLRQANAITEVRDAHALVDGIRESLENPQAAQQQGKRAQQAVDIRKGSLARSAEALESLLHHPRQNDK
jgi:3-deoxy-D-manno-octulosonic-acid transferase